MNAGRPRHQASDGPFLATNWLAVASAVAFTYVACDTLLLASHGLELTDEGYYLNAIAYADVYRSMPSMFGHFLHPVFDAVSGDLVRFRRLNVVVTFITALTVMCLVVDRRTHDTGTWVGSRRLLLSGICLGGATAAVLVFYRGLFTPNYNTLGFQALAWALIGVLIGTAPRSHLGGIPRTLGWLLAGGAIGLTFLNKPTSAPLAATFLASFAWLVGARGWKPVLTTGIASLLTVGMATWLTYGSLAVYWESINRGRVILELWTNARPLERVLGASQFPFSWAEASIATLLVLTIALAWLRPTAVAVGLSVVTGAVLAVSGWAATSGGLLRTVDSWVLVAIPVGAALTRRRSTGPNPPGILAAIPLALLPMAWALGTNNNLLHHAGGAGFFWIVAAVWIVAPQRPDVALMTASLAQITSILVLIAWTSSPYRQEVPLRLQNSAVQVGPWRSDLLVSAPMANYLKQLDEAGKAVGLPSRAPLIDLTFITPTAGFALGATNLSVPWHGSPALTGFALKAETCQTLRTAAILTDSRQVQVALLADLGLDFPADYTASRSIVAPDGSQQTLWMPRARNGSGC